MGRPSFGGLAGRRVTRIGLRMPLLKLVEQSLDWPFRLLSPLHPRHRRAVQAEIVGHLLLVPAQFLAKLFDVGLVKHDAMCA